MGYLSVDTVILVIGYHKRLRSAIGRTLPMPDKSSPCALLQQGPGSFLHLRSNQAGAVQQEEQGMRKLEVKRKEKKLSIFCMYNGEHGVQVIQTFHGWDVCLFYIILQFMH